MAAAERVVKHAVFSYTDPDGVYRTALRGDRISIDGDALERGERFDVFFGDEDVAVSSPLDGALAGDDEVLDGLVEEMDLVAAVAELDEEQRAALAAALAEASSDPSPAGAQPTALDEAGDELANTGVVEGPTPVDVERPPKTAIKEAWIDFRVAESGGRLTAEQLGADDGPTKAQLQDDAFVAALLSAQG